MKLNNKIQAFTLSEMIVVMILTSIVVGLAFSVLTLVQKQMNGIQYNFNQNAELNKLEQSLWLDFNKCSEIEYDDIENELKFYTEIDSISYFFKPDVIIKEKDTFNIQLESKKMFFNGLSTQKGKIDAIKLITIKSFLNQKLFIFKPNDANQFLD